MVRVRVPYTEPPEEPPRPMPAEPVVEPIDWPGVEGQTEKGLKKLLCKLIDAAIAWLLNLKARLRAPVKMVLPEIEEEKQ